MRRATGRRLFLVRHGSTRDTEEGRISGHSPVPLSARGRSEATRAAAMLARRRVDVVLTSPLERTVETARSVASPHRLEPSSETGLEELHLEGWAGKTREELAREPTWRLWLERPEVATTPQGESLLHVRARAMKATLEGLERIPDEGGLVVVTHGGVIRVLLLTMLGLPLSLYQKIRADTGSISALDVSLSGELLALRCVNLGGIGLGAETDDGG